LSERISQLLRKHRMTSMLLLILAIAFMTSCDNRVNDSVFASNRFTNIEQENLGDQIWSALAGDSSPLNVLSREENTLLYEFVETLYRQSYFILRGRDGWTTSRDWRLAIIQDDVQTAFTVPGGNFIISTGMLKTFRKEYELFYLFSFENSLMNSSEIYLDNLLSTIENSLVLDDLIETANPTIALEIGTELYGEQIFSPSIVAQIDVLAMDLICESSIFRTDGINQFLTLLNPDSRWAQSRSSSFDRLSVVNAFFLNQDCENTRRDTNLGPDYYVDVILPLIP